MSEAVFEERFVKLVEDNGGFEYYQAYRGHGDGSVVPLSK